MRLLGIRKAFADVVANDGVDLDLRGGEVHALLGENGAGKTTVMNILAGLYQPDDGLILLNGRPIELASPRDALRQGIGMVHQHFSLVPSLTALENVLLGLDAARAPREGGPRVAGWRLHRSAHRMSLQRLAAEFGLIVDFDARVEQLSIGERQRVEIIKMLYRNVRLLILDEPTAALTVEETEHLFRVLRRLVDDGLTVVLISHKLHEVVCVADRISILRRGRRVATVRAADTTPEQLAALMASDRAPSPAPVELAPGRRQAGEVVLRAEGLGVAGDNGRPAVRGVGFVVAAGEALGIAGVPGHGQRELVEALTGFRDPRGGRLWVADADVTRASIYRRTSLGLRYVPADRFGVGIAPNLSVAENLILRAFRDRAFGSRLWLRRRTVTEHARRLMQAFDITGCEPATPVRLLSGGNLQKVLLARELATAGRALIAESPARGLDVAGTLAVHGRLRELVRGGWAVLVVSEDVDELLHVCDRIVVMREGALVGELQGPGISRAHLAAMVAGVT